MQADARDESHTGRSLHPERGSQDNLLWGGMLDHGRSDLATTRSRVAWGAGWRQQRGLRHMGGMRAGVSGQRQTHTDLGRKLPCSKYPPEHRSSRWLSGYQGGFRARRRSLYTLRSAPSQPGAVRPPCTGTLVGGGATFLSLPCSFPPWRAASRGGSPRLRGAPAHPGASRSTAEHASTVPAPL